MISRVFAMSALLVSLMLSFSCSRNEDLKREKAELARRAEEMLRQQTTFEKQKLAFEQNREAVEREFARERERLASQTTELERQREEKQRRAKDDQRASKEMTETRERARKEERDRLLQASLAALETGKFDQAKLILIEARERSTQEEREQIDRSLIMVDEMISANRSYDSKAEVHSLSGTGIRGLYKIIFEVEICNLSVSESMTISALGSLEYLCDGNLYSANGPTDGSGNPVAVSIPPGETKTVYYENIRKGDPTSKATATFKYNHPDWKRISSK